tara:strand:- start:373 stop:1131 length:759 start_codon:yes stop_codon:yes gene_type:complete
MHLTRFDIRTFVSDIVDKVVLKTNIIDNVNIAYNTLPKAKLTRKQLAVDELFKPDLSGNSIWVSKDEISQVKCLNWGNNGAARHGIYFSDNRYIWEKEGKRAIQALRTVGFSDSVLYGASRPIRSDIHAFHKATGCVVCGSKSDLVTDHKNDLYNDPRVLNANTQTFDDFQCLCNHCNLTKRQVSVFTKEHNRRIGATTIPSIAIFNIDFIHGDETFNINDIDAMVGTYWYDPVAFLEFCKNRTFETIRVLK